MLADFTGGLFASSGHFNANVPDRKLADTSLGLSDDT